MATGGSIESVTLDGRYFPVAADADSPRNLGGDKNEVEPNGDGSGRLIKTRSAWSVTSLDISIDDVNSDQEFIQQLANRNDFFPCTITYASGIVYQGNGQVTGDNEVSSQATKMAVSLMGTGQLTKQ